jgi:hypothetical protein
MGKAIARKRRRGMTCMLRARLVDRHGRLLRPDNVEAMFFIALSFGDKPGKVRPLGAWALEPSEVILDGLHNDADWSVDVCGYNFRHLIDAGDFKYRSLPRRGEFRYFIRDTSGNISILRFQISEAEYD